MDGLPLHRGVMIRRVLCCGVLLAVARDPNDDPMPSLPNISELSAGGRLAGSLAHAPDASMQAPRFYHELARAAGQAWIQNVCATGLDAQAATVLLLSNEKATVFHFATEGAEVKAALAREFGDRYVEVEGETQAAVRKLARRQPRVRCDLLVVPDGNDSVSVAADLASFRELASPLRNEVFVVDPSKGQSTPRCLGCEIAWATAVKAGIIIPGTPVSVDGGSRLLAGEFEPKSVPPPGKPLGVLWVAPHKSGSVFLTHLLGAASGFLATCHLSDILCHCKGAVTIKTHRVPRGPGGYPDYYRLFKAAVDGQDRTKLFRKEDKPHTAGAALGAHRVRLWAPP